MSSIEYFLYKSVQFTLSMVVIIAIFQLMSALAEIV